MGFATGGIVPPAAVPDGTSLLIAGPPLTRKREVLLRLLAAGDPAERAIGITTKQGAEKFAEEYREHASGARADSLHVVDCVSRERGLGDARETDSRSYLSSPRDMTGLSIAITGLFRRYRERGLETRVGVHSLSTFLMYQDLQRVYRMLHVLTGQIETADWFGAFVVDSPTDRELAILSQLVDGVVETRETDTGVQLRLRGIGDDRSWRDV